MTEYVDNPHEHFVTPRVVVDGDYVLPTAAGCGAHLPGQQSMAARDGLITGEGAALQSV